MDVHASVDIYFKNSLKIPKR